MTEGRQLGATTLPSPRGTCARCQHIANCPKSISFDVSGHGRAPSKRQYRTQLNGSTKRCRGSPMSVKRAKRREGEVRSCQANQRGDANKRKPSKEILWCQLQLSPERNARTTTVKRVQYLCAKTPRYVKSTHIVLCKRG